MNVYERLLKYVVIRTPSNEESDTTPSTQCQFDLANVLKKEMKKRPLPAPKALTGVAFSFFLKLSAPGAAGCAQRR